MRIIYPDGQLNCHLQFRIKNQGSLNWERGRHDRRDEPRSEKESDSNKTFFVCDIVDFILKSEGEIGFEFDLKSDWIKKCM